MALTSFRIVEGSMTFREYAETFGSRFILEGDNLTVYSDRAELWELSDWYVTRTSGGITKLVRVVRIV
jgi:hypothetical protein